MMSTYAKLTEHNEHEGETWHFYIPLDGNHGALQVLAEVITESERDDTYELDLGPITEDEVDTLIRHGSDTDYMAGHNKLAGLLNITDQFLQEMRDDHGDPLYKGEVRNLMSVPA